VGKYTGLLSIGQVGNTWGKGRKEQKIVTQSLGEEEVNAVLGLMFPHCIC